MKLWASEVYHCCMVWSNLLKIEKNCEEIHWHLSTQKYVRFLLFLNDRQLVLIFLLWFKSLSRERAVYLWKCFVKTSVVPILHSSVLVYPIGKKEQLTIISLLSVIRYYSVCQNQRPLWNEKWWQFITEYVIKWGNTMKCENVINRYTH